MVDGVEDHRLKEIYIANAVASLISIAGCLFIISMYAIFKELRKLAFKLIVILSIFDLLNAISFVIPTYEAKNTDDVCVIQGILMNFSTFAAVIWTSFIALTLYLIVVKGFVDIKQLMSRYLVFNLLAACLIASIPNIDQISRSGEGYCWLYKGESKKRYTLRFFTFLIPLWCIILFNIILYIAVFRNLRGSEGGEVAEMRRKLSIRIGIYPLIIIICYLPYSIKGVLEVQEDPALDGYEYHFTLIAGVIRCLIGLFNAIAYGLTKRVRKIIKKKLCLRKNESVRGTLLTEYTN